MNAGFEDCSVMNALMHKYDDHWHEIFKEYEQIRKPNGDALQDLSLHNYLVMRDKVTHADYILSQKVEKRMAHLYPSQYFPLYSMVSFSDITYSQALKKGIDQERQVRDMIQNHNIDANTSLDVIDNIIHTHFSISYMQEA